jgi:hypothetical protein
LSPTWFLSLWEGTTVSTGAEGELILTGAYSRIILRHLSSATEAALRRLVHPGESEGRLAASVSSSDGPEALARWYYHLQQLAQRGFLLLSVHHDTQRVATLEPTALTAPTFSPGLPTRAAAATRWCWNHPGPLGASLSTSLGRRRSSTPWPGRGGRRKSQVASPVWRGKQGRTCSLFSSVPGWSWR